MSRAVRIFYLSFIIIFSGQKPFSQEAKNLTGTEVLALYEQLKNLELDQMKVAPVENFSLKRDVGIFQLNKGEIYLLKPVSGKVTGAVFIGEGTFKFSPSSEIERYQLEKFTGYEELSIGFRELYIRFSDTTFQELGSLNFTAGSIPGYAKDIFNFGEKRSQKMLNLSLRILEDILVDESEGLFYAEIKPEAGKRLFFVYNPEKIEEVRLLQEYHNGIDLVCSFSKGPGSAQGISVQSANKDRIKIEHYRMEITLPTTGNLTSNCEVDLSYLKSGLKILNFDLTDQLKVSQVKNEAGKELNFIQEKEFSEVAVILENPSVNGQKGKLIFNYSGDILSRNVYGDFYIESSDFWYPQYGYNKRSTFDLTFKTSPDLKFVSIGKKVLEKKEKDFLYTQWKQEIPVSSASFNLGNFDVLDLKNEGIPDVSVYYVEASHRQFTQDYNQVSLLFPEMDLIVQDAHIMENIGADVVNSLNFFQNVFGKCPFSKISVTEIPADYGQGFPGLLHLSWMSFQNEVKGATEYFRSHEVAHQWWAYQVGWKSYHDQWLSEGMATYSGAWFTQVSLRDNKRFFEIIEYWQKNIFGKGEFGSKGTKAGPLWLGCRLTSSKSSDYHTLVYQKGAYVFHMLRNMMMDFKTMNDDKFVNMIKDFVITYSGNEASTEDFKKIVDKHFGEDMSWFFNEWVYGIEIPTYTVSRDIEQTEDGKFTVNLKVKQENVSEGFKMVVPVVMNFGGDKYAVVKVLIDKPYTEVKLPKAPMEPKGIVFNPFNSVLCEVKYK
jgi:hypothetical protein